MRVNNLQIKPAKYISPGINFKILILFLILIYIDHITKGEIIIFKSIFSSPKSFVYHIALGSYRIWLNSSLGPSVQVYIIGKTPSHFFHLIPTDDDSLHTFSN